MRTQIKSPTHFIVQTCKALECPLPAPHIAQNAMRQMGQILFAPPKCERMGRRKKLDQHVDPAFSQ